MTGGACLILHTFIDPNYCSDIWSYSTKSLKKSYQLMPELQLQDTEYLSCHAYQTVRQGLIGGCKCLSVMEDNVNVITTSYWYFSRCLDSLSISSISDSIDLQYTISISSSGSPINVTVTIAEIASFAGKMQKSRKLIISSSFTWYPGLVETCMLSMATVRTGTLTMMGRMCFASNYWILNTQHVGVQASSSHVILIKVEIKFLRSVFAI